MKNQFQLFMALVTLAGLSVSFGSGFLDSHDNGSLDGWTIYGSREWRETGGAAGPVDGNASGFLIKEYNNADNGTIEVDIIADQWNGDNGGIVFRFTSTTQYYFVAVNPGNQWSNHIVLCKNNMNAENGTVIARNFPMPSSFTLKVVMDGSTFSFYLNDELKGEITDGDNPTGRIGYGHNTTWYGNIDFEEISWTDDGPEIFSVTMNWLGQLSEAPVKAQNGDAYHNSTDDKSYVLFENKWTILADVSVMPQGDKPAHEWDGTMLRFENPDGTMGEYANLVGPPGPQGEKGEPGEDGEDGVPGDNVWSVSGNEITTPPNSIVKISEVLHLSPLSEAPTGYLGDFYVNNAGNLFFHNGVAWRKIQFVQTPLKDVQTPLIDSRDDKEYKTVKIGDQTWMAENLNHLTMDSWCYDDNGVNCTTYGRLYDWHTAVDVCPSGWHLPSAEEWSVLVSHVGSIPGLKLKSDESWDGSNDFSFSALPAGWRGFISSFGNLGFTANFWTATEYDATAAWTRTLFTGDGGVLRQLGSKESGLSVRCLED